MFPGLQYIRRRVLLYLVGCRFFGGGMVCTKDEGRLCSVGVENHFVEIRGAWSNRY